MSLAPLSALLNESLELLNHLLTHDFPLMEDIELAGLIHAAWMRLKNWESDIKNEERATLKEILKLSPLTADIVRDRLDSLLQNASFVKDVCSTTASGNPEENRYV